MSAWRYAKDSREAEFALLMRYARMGIGEVQGAIGAADHVVRTVEALTLKVVCDNGDRAVASHTSNLPIVSLAHDDQTVEVERAPVAVTGVVAKDRNCAVALPLHQLALLMTDEGEVPVWVPHGSFGVATAD